MEPSDARSAKVRDSSGHRGGGFVEIGVDEVAPVLRVEPGRESGRADEVTEHDRDRAALG
jgi:hypothetical protein